MLVITATYYMHPQILGLLKIGAELLAPDFI